jgi:hypothetical protein
MEANTNFKVRELAASEIELVSGGMAVAGEPQDPGQPEPLLDLGRGGLLPRPILTNWPTPVFETLD